MIKRIGIIVGGGILLIIVLFGWWAFYSRPELGTTGSVSTHFRLFGLSDKIVIDSFNDPEVQGVVCHIAREKRGV